MPRFLSEKYSSIKAYNNERRKCTLHRNRKPKNTHLGGEPVEEFRRAIGVRKEGKPVKVAVAQANDMEVIETVKMATEKGIAQFYLVGDAKEIQEKCQQLNVDMNKVEIIDEPELENAPRAAVSLVSSGKAQVVMKGLIHTADYLRAILDKEIG